MAVTYVSTLPTDKDRVRFFIQDTVVATALLQDEEINAIIGLYGTYQTAAVACCDVLASKYAGESDMEEIGNLKVSASSVSKKYRDLSTRLRELFSRTIGAYSGGISKGDKELNVLDDDRVQPGFRRNQMDKITPTPNINWGR